MHIKSSETEVSETTPDTASETTTETLPTTETVVSETTTETPPEQVDATPSCSRRSSHRRLRRTASAPPGQNT